MLGLAPSGTRKLGSHWKSGFYHIARAANVPVVLGFIDFGTRRVGLADVVHLSGDIASDMDRIRAAYQGVKGRNPHRQMPIRLAGEE